MSSIHSRASQKEFADEAVAAQQSSGRSCDRLRQELKRCIKESDCVQKERRSAKDCINATDGSVPHRCFTLLSNFSDCKRSLVGFAFLILSLIFVIHAHSRFQRRSGYI
uniref:Cytochrome c oxidase assembly factor 5 n=1 Tax=Ascaris lumbricoides TaxID=6252 RepID=A0A0M3IK07_ASCLU